MGLLSLINGDGFFADNGEVMPGHHNGASNLLNVEHAISDKYLGTTYGQQNIMGIQYGYNRQLAQDERTWQQQMMDKMNQYNSPANQMALLRAAGLNPSLMYGQMSDIGSANPPSAGAASVSALPPQYGAADSLLLAKIANINADTENKRAETKGKEIQNTIDSMNSEAFTTFYNQNKNDIIRIMSQELGIKQNEYALSNYELFEAAWNFSVMYGFSLENALKTGQMVNGSQWELWYDYISDDTADMWSKAKSHFVGGRDAEISVFAANKVLADAQRLKGQKDFDIWKHLIDLSRNGDKFERLGAQIALTALFISGEKFSLPMPSFNFRSNHYHKR